MLGQDDLLFVQFRLEAEAALLRIVHDFEAQGLTAAEAIEQATVECGRLLNAERIGRLPAFDEHGRLPAAQRCSAEEFFRRFGSSSTRRKEVSAAFSEVVRRTPSTAPSVNRLKSCGTGGRESTRTAIR